MHQKNQLHTLAVRRLLSHKDQSPTSQVFPFRSKLLEAIPFVFYSRSSYISVNIFQHPFYAPKQLAITCQAEQMRFFKNITIQLPPNTLLHPLAASAGTKTPDFITFKSINYLEKAPFQRDSSINYLVFEQETKTIKEENRFLERAVGPHEHTCTLTTCLKQNKNAKTEQPLKPKTHMHTQAHQVPEPAGAKDPQLHQGISGQVFP